METKTQSKLDLLLLKALSLENSVLTPTQSVEDALEAFFTRAGREEFDDFDDFVSFSKNSETWQVAVRKVAALPNQHRHWFQDKDLSLALSKAFFWATSAFSVEEVERLFKRS